MTRMCRRTLHERPAPTLGPEPSYAKLAATPVRCAHRRVRHAPAPPSSQVCDLGAAWQFEALHFGIAHSRR
jgi:hypothetical protein